MTQEHTSQKMPAISLAEKPRKVEGRLHVKVNIRTNEQTIPATDDRPISYTYDMQVRELDLPEDTDIDAYIVANEAAILARASVPSTEQLSAFIAQIKKLNTKTGCIVDKEFSDVTDKLDSQVSEEEVIIKK